MRLDNIPMLKPFLSLLTGILLSYYFDADASWFLGLVLLFLLIGFFSMWRKLTHTRWMLISSISFLCSLMAAGAYSYSSSHHYVRLQDGMYSYTAVVDKIISQKTGYTRCYLKLISVKDTALTQSYSVIANVYSDELLPSDTIYAQSYIKHFSPAYNAGQFNLKEYYGYKHIYQTTSVANERFSKAEYQGRFHFQRWCFQAALWCKDVYVKYIPSRSAITMQALLLGVKNDISEDMMNVYMNTGVMHVLAVSGMHVGILYLGIMVLLKPIYRRWSLISILPIILVWVFSFITGGGPAILRAAIMITFVDMGKKLNEDSHSTNLLFVSGFCLLMFQPYLVWDIGFQLSFAAMLGLFYLMTPIQNLIWVKRRWVKEYIWSPSVMSLSAQLATTPLTFYYFGNFPIYFLITNLLILLPVTIALYSGVILLLTSIILPESINLFIGKMIDFFVYYGFDALLEWMAQLPAAYANQIYLSFWQVIFLLLAIFFLGYWMYHLKNGKWLVYSFLLCTVTVFGSFVRQFQLKRSASVSILHIPKSSAVVVDNYIWTPLQNNLMVVKDNGFSLQGYLREKGWKKWQYLPPEHVQMDSFSLVVGDKSFYLLHEPLKSFYPDKKVEADYLILGADFYLNIEQLKERFKFQTIVLDGSLDYSKYGLFKKMLTEANIEYWDTREQGALEINL